MREFHPYFTNDGSVGLYNEEYNDIYHSAKGALTEAYDKFVNPVDFDNLFKNEKVKVLDICYGIGYNSKSFLNFILEKLINKNKSNHAIDTIDTNKNISVNNDFNIDTIDSDNIFDKISVTAIDNDKNLGFISPFIKTGNEKFTNKNVNFKYKNIEKYIYDGKKSKLQNLPKINNLINFLIFQNISQKYPDFICNEIINNILFDDQYKEYFSDDIKGIYALLSSSLGKSKPFANKPRFLHNIYYNHISNKYKKDLKRYNLQDVNFDMNFDDARDFIKSDNNLYNLIFLDAFTPTKCPCLWSYEFFKQLFDHLEDNGQILTYTSSAAVRGAMLAAGFNVGKIYSKAEKKYIGTICAKSKSLIKIPLSEYDLGLIKSRAGIFYRDENLTGQNEAIIKTRNFEAEQSNRISSSQYNKLHEY